MIPIMVIPTAEVIGMVFILAGEIQQQTGLLVLPQPILVNYRVIREIIQTAENSIFILLMVLIIKLISHGPEDCATVKSKYPSLIDPARDCWAFGYWTPGAVNW